MCVTIKDNFLVRRNRTTTCIYDNKLFENKRKKLTLLQLSNT